MILIDDRELDEVIYSPTCAGCKHFNYIDPRARVCDAFPDGIPEVIWIGKNDHRKPYPGDHGILFEKK